MSQIAYSRCMPSGRPRPDYRATTGSGQPSTDGRLTRRRSRIQGALVALVGMIATVISAGVMTPASPASPPSAQASSRTAAEAQTMVVLTNRLRSSLGADSLAVRDDLTQLACDWADTLVELNNLEHSPFISDRQLFTARLGHGWVLAGENVGTGPDVYTIHSALVRSSSHYRNLVNPEFVYVGVCVRHAPDGTAFIAQEFLAPKSSRRAKG